jgi:hypothetical protein
MMASGQRVLEEPDKSERRFLSEPTEPKDTVVDQQPASSRRRNSSVSLSDRWAFSKPNADALIEEFGDRWPIGFSAPSVRAVYDSCSFLVMAIRPTGTRMVNMPVMGQLNTANRNVCRRLSLQRANCTDFFDPN